MIWTGPVNSERRRLIEACRKNDPAGTAGCSDAQVEAMALGVLDASTEALAYALNARGYRVVLEVG